MQRSFDISVMTPVGKFSGTIEFTVENAVVHGFLSQSTEKTPPSNRR